MEPIYCVIISVCFIASVGMIFHVHSNSAISRQSKKWFSLVYLCTAIGAAAEFMGRFMDLHPVNSTLHIIVKLVEFCIMPMFPVLIAYGCGLEKPSRFVVIIILFHAVLEIILAPFGKIIRVGSDGLYHRGEWYEIYMAVYTISSVYLLVMFLELSRRFQNRDLVTLFTAFLCALAAVAPAVFHSSIRTSFLGITLTGIILYMYFEGLTMQDMAVDIEEKNKKIQMAQEHLIIGIAGLIECRDGSTGTHVKNTATYVSLLTEAALREGLYPETINEQYKDMIIMAAPLHDIGKISVPDSILLKPGQLTAEEYEIMKRHEPEGGRIVNNLLTDIANEEYRKIVFDVVNYHHEHWDGSGYPEGLKGEEIPISARIMAIADVYDALTMARVYKDAVPPEKALDIIESECGRQFDPKLGALFVQVMRS